MGRGRRSRYDDYWPAYVPVSERRAQAKREVTKLRKEGEEIQPVEIEGRTIARSFWAKGWCTHLESFGDYSNRLPRGRTYVRYGSVCHLGIKKGRVEAMVSGSELYRVSIEITPLKKSKWKALKQHCTGKIGSLIELLRGKLSDEIMSAVTDRTHGLFPLPGEIKYACNCPDWADMCKHISAVMYGIGARLDSQPELLFLLRGVDYEKLITADADADAITGSGSRRARRRSLSDRDLEKVFGVELDAPPKTDTMIQVGHAATSRRKPQQTGGRAASKQAGTQEKATSSSPKRRSTERKATAKKKTAKSKAAFKPSARSVAKLRQRLGMNTAEFAHAVGVSPGTVANWEKASGLIKPHATGLAGLNRLLKQGR